MTDYHNNDRDTVTVKKRSGGTILAIILLTVAAIVFILFATGFWSANVTKSGALPEVSVKGGEMPKVDMHSEQVVVGTTKAKVVVPKVKTETETIEVPTVGVKK